MKNLYITVLTFIIISFATTFKLSAQGCVAIRHFSGCGTMSSQSSVLSPGEWTLSSNYRYFRSFRHFRGTEEEPDRVAHQTEVINSTHSLDLGITYAITGRMYANASVPLVFNVRSSLYEHGRQNRYTTSSQGLSDMRLGVGYWLLSPAKNTKGNLALGLGIKLPTGDYQAEDKFYNVGPNGEAQVRPVDQSIQLGDGGVGFSVDFQTIRLLNDHFSVYADGFYLFNPKETNGVRTFRETLNPILANESIMSVADQYGLRAGMNFATPLHGLALGLGGRWEGIPVKDIIGGSEGFRRPGYVVSVEPTISYMRNQFTLNVNVPVALIRNRQQSLTDKETEMLTGEPRHGDAAFADYLINVGLVWRIAKKSAPVQFNLNNEL